MKTLKTLPSIPKSIPTRILEQVKAKGLVYVGKGRLRSQGCLFPDGEVSFRYNKPDKGNLLERDTWNGTTPTADYFTSPAIAAKYFSLPKKTSQILTRGADGRFVSSKLTAAQTKKEEKPRRPKQGEVWQSDYGMDHLVARVSSNTALLISVCGANRKNEKALELDGNNSVPNDQNLTFVAASLEEYFKAKLKA